MNNTCKYNNLTKKEYNQLQGKMNKSAGEQFENLIIASCYYYEAQHKAYIEKTPEPFRVIGKNIDATNRLIFKGVFKKKGQPDFKGTLQSGKAICFEAKHTDADRIEQSRVTEEQARALSIHSKLGAEAFVIVSLKMQNFYCVPWKIWADMKNIYGRKYMTKKELEQYQVPFQNGVIKFLAPLEEQINLQTEQNKCESKQLERTKRVFISGKISEDCNYKKKFENKTQELRRKGYLVFNPADIINPHMEYDEQMKQCFELIDIVDEVYFLKDYRISKGSMMEYSYAKSKNKTMVIEA